MNLEGQRLLGTLAGLTHLITLCKIQQHLSPLVAKKVGCSLVEPTQIQQMQVGAGVLTLKHTMIQDTTSSIQLVIKRVAQQKPHQTVLMQYVIIPQQKILHPGYIMKDQ